MLLELVVENIVIIADARIAPERGLCVISGETGAGKSLLLDALGLLRGDRADSRLIGPRGDSASACAVIEVPDAVMDDLSMEQRALIDEGQIILRRRITRQGRSQAWINERPVSAGTLREFGRRLIDIRGQHEHVHLAAPERQRALLDALGGLDAEVRAYRQARSAWQEAQHELEQLATGAADSLKERDYLGFLLDELETLDPRPGELAALDQRLDLLAHAEKWAALAQEAGQVLYEAEGSAQEQMGRFARRLVEAPQAQLQAAGEQLMQAQELLREAAMSCLAAAEDIDLDPAERQHIEERLGQYQDLLRKHGNSEEQLLAARAELAARHAQLSGLDERRAALDASLPALAAAHDEAAHALKAARRRAFTRLAKGVHRELADLGMPKARLSLHEGAGGGADVQEFLLQTNPGLRAGPLGQVASGGEAARVALALASVAAAHDAVPVLVFDEVDSGVGGRLGLAIASKLHILAAARSVLAITHTPQIAAAADRHYLVSKRHHGDKETIISVDEMSGAQRVDEIADMLGGGAAARGQAEALLEAGA